MTTRAADAARGEGRARDVRRRYHVGRAFLVYCGLTVLVALAAANGGSNLLIWVFGVLAAAMLVSGVVSGATMLRLSVRRLHPGHGRVGEPLMVRYAVTNRTRFLPAFNLYIEECPDERASRRWTTLLTPGPAWIMHLGPRQTVHGEALFWPRRRGEATLGALRLRSSFPFGLIMKSMTRTQVQRVLVYPRVFPLRRRVLRSLMPPIALGVNVTPYPGSGSDFYGLREFRPGDSMRNIAWKRTANRDDLVSIERTRPAPPRLRVVLNLTRPTSELTPDPDGPAPRGLEEDAISLAASLVAAADRIGFEVGLTILGLDLDDGATQVPMRRGHWHRNRIMAALAAIDLDAPRREPHADEIPGPDRAAVVVVHPDRAELQYGPGSALHLTAAQLEHLTDTTDALEDARPDDARQVLAEDGAGDAAAEVAA